EIAQMETRMERHLENKTEEEKEEVKGFVGARKSFGFEKVKNLGDAAYWRFNTERGGEMVSLFGNETFTVYTKISHDADENLERAQMETRMERHLENKTEEEKEEVKGFVGARKSFGFEKVKNLGDAAYWRFNTERGGEMVSLFGNETFTVYTKISHDADENLE